MEPEENEQFLERRAPNLQLELVRRERTLPAGLPGEPNTVYRDGGTVTLCAGRSKIAASEHVPDMRLSDLLHDRTIRVRSVRVIEKR